MQVHAYFDIELQNCEQVGGDKDSFMDLTDVKVKKVNKTSRALFGKAVYHVDIDDTYDIETKAFVKQGGEYRQSPFTIKKQQYCKFFQEDTFYYPEVTKVSDFPLPHPCPFEKVRNC